MSITAETKCSYCFKTICCQYITQQIDSPKKKADFQVMLWQIAHANVEFYKDEDGWFLMFITPCEQLEATGGCAIYNQRPDICREYDNDYCEYDASAEENFELYFKTYDELLSYCRKRFKKWDKKK
ncbi:MAG: YkgJ family cysteine cluster protein [Gammaproteobacteria bacterium]|nr:YkgJ family cysteine cluster protein [Gammaproteobacteria bacterium]